MTMLPSIFFVLLKLMVWIIYVCRENFFIYLFYICNQLWGGGGGVCPAGCHSGQIM